MSCEVELVEEREFFAPASSDLIDSLVGQYNVLKHRINAVAKYVNGDEASSVISYFLDGNCDQERGRMSLKRSSEQLFDPAGAVAALNSAYWSKAIHVTDVLNYMPNSRRDEWHKSIREQTCPEFLDETVRGTITSLLAMRSQFLAERVDGIFRGLSGEHVTNSPAAFGKRMIVSYVLNEWNSENYSKCGLINDLRCVVAKFMGRDEPGYNSSSGLIRSLKGRWGQWVSVDGGALKVRLYKKGTAHIEVHPDMAWRLNSTLAHLYPMAIPPEFRTKPKRKAKEVQLIQRPLPFAVIEILAGMKTAQRFIKQPENFRNPVRYETVSNSLKYEYSGERDKHALAEADEVLSMIGGVKVEGWWQFDYEPHEIVEEIVASGIVPDSKSHQYYPTPENLAQMVVDIAEIGPDDECLEPSAGSGSIADLMPKDRTQCVEVSRLRCDVLTAKGYSPVCADFIKWADETGEKFDRICLNPPFDRGQWSAHVTAAASLLNHGGALVAIIPSSAIGKEIVPGMNHEYTKAFSDEFKGASVSVTIIKLTKK